MIITYQQDQANQNIYSKYFDAHRWSKQADTLILDILWQTIAENEEKSFEEVCLAVKAAYKNKTVKSRIEIYEAENKLEIIKKGVFPSILIWKK